jgi:hypothetical protein
MGGFVDNSATLAEVEELIGAGGGGGLSEPVTFTQDVSFETGVVLGFGGDVFLSHRAAGADGWGASEGLRLDGTLDLVDNFMERIGDLSMGPLGQVGIYYDGDAGVGLYNYLTMLFDPYIEMKSGVAPGVAAADAGSWYMHKNGAGKMEARVQFPTGGPVVLATEA